MNTRMTYADASEGVKSNALVRCCKDLGIASECWDKRFTEPFKAKYCIAVWRRDAKKRVPQWRRRDAEPFFDEEGEAKSRHGAAHDAQLPQASSGEPEHEATNGNGKPAPGWQPIRRMTCPACGAGPRGKEEGPLRASKEGGGYLTEARKEALINMCFNMGRPTMLTFHNTILAVRQGEWLRAAAHAQQSLWYRQVGQRARRIVDELRTGYLSDTTKTATTKEPDKPATDKPTTLLGWLRKLLLVRRSNT